MALPQWLQDAAPVICAAQPEQQSIPYYLETWQKQFPHDCELEWLGLRFGSEISRSDLYAVSRLASHSGELVDLRRMLIGVMLWGFGTVGYGAHRTREMLESPGCLESLAAALGCLRRDDLGAAYRTMRRAGIRMCGTTSATKLLYFGGKGLGVARYPLILDNRVASSLKQRLDSGAYRALCSDSAASYSRYVQQMHEWADQLGCEAHNIEYYLFSL